MQIENDVKKAINDFLLESSDRILVLESMNVADRDSWVRFLQNTVKKLKLGLILHESAKDTGSKRNKYRRYL